MRDCRAGKIDRILVKSVSRFARNAQDCIKAVRELKDLGVTVAFEKERINTAVMSNEMFLSMMSAFAQEESLSISQNMRKGAVMRMQNGTFRLSQPPYGYRLDEGGMLVIQPEEAEIVRRIFESFLSGKGIREIALELETEKIPKRNGAPVWSYTGVLYILSNERYMGDERLQKFRTTPREIFQEVQLEIARRNSKRKVSCRRTKSEQGKYTSKFALSERLVCGECGAMYRRTQWIKRDGTKENVWRCINRLEFGKKYCQHSPSLKEPILHEAILNCIRSVYHSREEILQAMQAAEKKVLFIGEQKEDPEAIRRKIQHIEQEMGSLLVFAAQSEKMEMFEERFKAMTKEKTELTEKLQQLEAQAPAREEKGKRVEAENLSLSEFDDDFIRRVVEQVTVLSAEQIEVRFVGGFSKVGEIPK